MKSGHASLKFDNFIEKNELYATEDKRSHIWSLLVFLSSVDTAKYPKRGIIVHPKLIYTCCLLLIRDPENILADKAVFKS